MKKMISTLLVSSALALSLITGCSNATASQSTANSASSSSVATTSASTGTSSTTSTSASTTNATFYQASDVFTSRDLEQTADTSNAKTITLTSGENVTISEEGVYVISGTAQDTTITVNADSSAKVQLVLDGVTVTNANAPAIYVESADKVFVTTASGSTNTLSVTSSFATTSSDSTVDGVVFSRDDLVLNGQGTLVVNSTGNGIVGKDDVKVTGGTYKIDATGHGIQGKDSVAVSDGTFTITAGSDGIHSENADDLSLGYVYIAGGTFNITATSDGIRATTLAQIDGGTISVHAAEGLEGTYVQVNGGNVSVNATDDGINATSKSTAYNVTLEINGGEVTVDMGQGDTDALDSNGDLYINGGTVAITAQSPFDWDGTGKLNGGTVTVNGTQVTELTNSMMGGGMGNRQQGNMNGQQQGTMGNQGKQQNVMR